MSKDVEKKMNRIDEYVTGLFGEDFFEDDNGQSANRIIAFFRKNFIAFGVLAAYRKEDEVEFYRSNFYNGLVRAAAREVDNFEIHVQLSEFISCLEATKPMKEEYVVGKVTEEEREKAIKNAEGWKINPFTGESDEYKEIELREEEANIPMDQVHAEFAVNRNNGTLDISETHCHVCGREFEGGGDDLRLKLKKFNELQESLEDKQPTSGLPVALPNKEEESTSGDGFDANAMSTLGLKPEDFDKIDKYEEMEKENEKMKQLIDKRNNANDFWTRDNRGLLDRVLGRFASRKLLAFVVTTVAFFMGLLVSQYYMAIVMTYIGSQAAVDLFNKVRLPQVDSEAWKVQEKRIATAATLADKINGKNPVTQSTLKNKTFL